MSVITISNRAHLALFFVLALGGSANAAVHRYHLLDPDPAPPDNSNKTPDQAPWSWSTSANDVEDTQTVVTSQWLTIVDADGAGVDLIANDNAGSGDPGRFYTRNVPADLNASTLFEARSRVRVTSYSDPTGHRGLYDVFVDDGPGGKTLAWGAALSAGGAQEFFLMNTSSGAPIPSTTLTFADNGFHDVLFAKVPDGGSSYNILLSVDGGAPVTVAYTNLNWLAGTATANLFWGAGSSPARGSMDLVGQTFGFGEPAPAAPEPSTLTLLATGALALLRRRQRCENRRLAGAWCAHVNHAAVRLLGAWCRGNQLEVMLT